MRLKKPRRIVLGFSFAAVVAIAIYGPLLFGREELTAWTIRAALGAILLTIVIVALVDSSITVGTKALVVAAAIAGVLLVLRMHSCAHTLRSLG